MAVAIFFYFPSVCLLTERKVVYDTTFSGGQAPTKSVIPQWPYSSIPDCKASGKWENFIKETKAMKKANKLIAVLLCLVMILSISPVNVFAATNPTSLTGYGSSIGGITISGVSVEGTPSLTTSTTSYGNVYTYNITLAANTTANPTVTFVSPSSTAVISTFPPTANEHMIGSSNKSTYTVTMSDGVGTLSVFVYHNLQSGRNNDRYIFNFSLSTGDSSSEQEQYGGVTIQFGDPAANLTWPESFMELQGSNGTYTAVYTGSDAQYYYPGSLSFFADAGSTNLTLSGNGVQFVTFAGNMQVHNSITTSANGSDLFTLKINQAGTVTITGGSQTITVSFSAPKSDYPDSDNTPSGLNGYLPIGQFATGSEWGNATGKVAGGYDATGVSLGAAGGYIEFNMSVVNSDTTPYGVDFVVYGNAFDGNPEAASVMVYGTPQGGSAGWYELAGSLYYADETLRNVDVTYKKESSGIKYKVTRGSTVLCDWTTFTGSTAWWPETSEGYNSTWGLGDSSMVTVNASNTEITYHGVTLVRDTDVTADYTFGYADITPNGTNITYGTATNPYATNTTGGNSFDISWAVDENGNPVKLGSISKVRVYTSAVLDITSSTPVFTTPALFGETSAEVCGIYSVSGGGGGAATTDLTVKKKNTSKVTLNAMGTTEISAGVSYTVKSSEANVYINGVKINASSGYSFTPVAGQKYQIITQNGSEAPFITVLIGK